MSFTRLPFTALALSFLTGILVWDLIFDFSLDKQGTYNYFWTMRNERYPFSLVIPFVILFGFIPVFINLYIKYRIWDVLTLLCSIPNCYIFLGLLVPTQLEMVKLKYDDPKNVTNYEINKILHLVCMVLNILSLIFILSSEHSSPQW